MKTVLPEFKKICDSAGPDFSWAHNHFEGLQFHRNILTPAIFGKTLQIYKNDKAVTAGTNITSFNILAEFQTELAFQVLESVVEGMIWENPDELKKFKIFIRSKGNYHGCYKQVIELVHSYQNQKMDDKEFMKSIHELKKETKNCFLLLVER